MSWWVALGALAVSGCEHGEGSLWDLHMSNNPKAQAKARWEAVRGSVKLQLAEEHLKSGRIEEAERSLEEALAMCPQDPRAFVLATRLRLEQGRLAEAREAITVAATLNDSDPEIPYFAGLVAQRYGDLETAYEHYTAAATMAPHVAAYVLARAQTLVNLDRPIDALELVRGRLNDFDQNVSMRMLAARICRILGLRGPAITYCREAVRIGNDSDPLVAELGLILVWAERYRDAINVLSPLVENAEIKPALSDKAADALENSPAPSVARALARSYVETNQGSKAIGVLRRLLESNPEDSLAWSLCARAALLADDVKTAEEALEKVQAQGATTAETSVLSAFMSLRRGDFERARRQAADALKLNGQFATAHCLVGQASEALGEKDAALASYEAAIQIDPNSSIAKRRIEALDVRTDPPPPPPADDGVENRVDLQDLVGSACPPEETAP